MNNRWWTYQKERFPLLAHGPLVLVFCIAIMLFSALQHGDALPDVSRIVGAFVSTLILFFQLRVADEYKDFDIDSRYRPHRAVPRGLVSLPELGRLAVAGAVIQFLLAAYIDFGLIPILIGVWCYIGLMTREFFVPEWLNRHPLAYLLSHMVVMPLIAFYVSTFEWLCECSEMPAGLGWLLLLSFGCGLVLEIGRKIVVPRDERAGVDTYSGSWGFRRALICWVLALAGSVYVYLRAAAYVGDVVFHLLPAGLVLLAALAIALRGGRGRSRRSAVAASLVEPLSGVAALLLYFGLGPLNALLAS